MRKFALIGVVFAASALSQERVTSRHLAAASQPLTAASNRTAHEIGRDFLRSTAAADFGLPPGDLDASAYVSREYTDSHNEVRHLLFRQQFRGVEVYNSAYVINIDRNGSVLNAGGELFASPAGALPDNASAFAAVRSAVKATSPRSAAQYAPFPSQKAPSGKSAIRFAAGNLPGDINGRAIWYGIRGATVPAWLFYMTGEDGIRYAVVVDAHKRAVLSKRSLMAFQSAQARGLVFEGDSPQPAPKPGVLVTGPPPFIQRTLQPFTGDPVASPRGWVVNNETAGNNAIVGANLLGAYPFIPVPTKAPDGDFSFPLEVGLGAASPLLFVDASNTNLFYWVNRAHDLFYRDGFTEGAGNFQQDNYGRGGAGGDPVYAYTFYAAQDRYYAQTQNAWFSSSNDDGEYPELAIMVSFGNGIVTDVALDAPTIVHEYTHGVSTRLLPAGYDNFQTGAMGEGWSDFFAFDYLLPEGSPVDGSYAFSEYPEQTWAKGIRSRPYSTNMDVNPLTFQNLGRVRGIPEVHDDGEIWAQALWEVRANLIKQFGDKEGRRRTRVVVLDGMKLAPPRSSMVDMRDAILLADRVGFKGASQDQLWAAFAKRGLGALAYSESGDTIHVTASFESASNKGKIGFAEKTANIDEPVVVVVQDSNATEKSVVVQLTTSSGDVESIALRRSGSIYTGLIWPERRPAVSGDKALQLMPGDYVSAYYTDYDAPGGATQVQATILSSGPYEIFSDQKKYEFANEQLVGISGTAPITLPFDFPFYGRTYRSAVLHENGMISFGPSLMLDIYSYCTDIITLSQLPAIAPLWTNITVNSDGQPREGVYRSVGPDSVTFRWVGETVTAYADYMPGSPVNFAVTLYSDGQILFQYGSGNTELASADVYPLCGAGPMIGISSGNNAYPLLVNLPYLSSAPSVRFVPPFGPSSLPVVTVEKPASADSISGVVSVSGVAYDPESTITYGAVLVDGTHVASARLGLARPDFCSQQNVKGCPNVGWSATVDTAKFGAGEHKLSVRFTNARGGFVDAPPQPLTFTVDKTSGRLPVGKIESPAEGAEVKGTLLVRGYAAIADLAVTAVDTLIDGVTYGPTTYGLTRSDVCGTLDPRPASCPRVGFQLSVNTRSAQPPIANGQHTVQVRVLDESGRYTLIPEKPVTFTVSNAEAVTFAGEITSPKPAETISGTVTISGWGYASGARVRTAALVVDDLINYGSLTYGQAKPEVCAGLPDVTACPNIGFTGTFDTRRLTNGPHLFSVRLTTDTGDTIRIPATGAGRLSVIVKND